MGRKTRKKENVVKYTISTPYSSAQIPWLNTPVETEHEDDHLSDVADGERTALIKRTSDYSIYLPHTLAALSELAGASLVGTAQRGEGVLNSALNNGFTYVVDYSNFADGPAYHHALIIVTGTAIEIRTSDSKTWKEQDFILNFSTNGGETFPNQDILVDIKDDASGRDKNFHTQVSETKNWGAVKDIVDADVRHIREVLHNPAIPDPSLSYFLSRLKEMPSLVLQAELANTISRHPMFGEESFATLKALPPWIAAAALTSPYLSVEQNAEVLALINVGVPFSTILKSAIASKNTSNAALSAAFEMAITIMGKQGAAELGEQIIKHPNCDAILKRIIEGGRKRSSLNQKMQRILLGR